MRKTIRFLTLLVAFTFLLAVVERPASACPSCSATLSGDDTSKQAPADGRTTAYFWSIVSLGGLPFVIFGLVGGALYRAHARSRRLDS